MTSFKRAVFEKEDMLAKYKKPTDRFDGDWDFVHSVVFNENHPDLDLEFKGHLWMKEMFMMSEAHIPNLHMPTAMIVGMVISMAYLVAEMLYARFRTKTPMEMMSMKMLADMGIGMPMPGS